ncbi:LVIVD repeat-containing protein [Flammeovirga aprica]|uniref:LVIVD repeat-containing protein n=1 Tax=Flammeovirga aprica JL-4 TaxID=694437 RepID=A0A7X9RV00_9BACT|nr:hypothetical protein [Flammeovirga aprica]NME69210.1 hypothetical protein [Flammeovirga aprica JL-4]
MMNKLNIITQVLAILILFSCSENMENGSDASSESGIGQGGSLATFAIKGDYLYTVEYEKLKVFSLQDPQAPVLVNNIWVGFEIETLFSYKEFLYIGSRGGMYIFSLENPEEPRNRASVQHFTACDPVVANDTLAFVTLHSNSNCGNNINQLEIYDIKDADNPVLLNTRGLIEPKGLGLYGNYLIVCDDEIKVFEIKEGQEGEVAFVTSIDKEAFDVIIQNDLLIAVGNEGVYQYTLYKNDNTFLVGHLSTINF